MAVDVAYRQKHKYKTPDEKAKAMLDNLKEFVTNLVWVNQKFDSLPNEQKIKSSLFKKMLANTLNSDIDPRIKASIAKQYFK